MGIASRLGRVAELIFGRQAVLRYAYLVLGGAVLGLYYILLLPVVWWLDGWSALDLLSLYMWASALSFNADSLFSALPPVAVLVAVTAFFPFVRSREVIAVRGLLGGPAARLAPRLATSASMRVRAAIWYVVHLLSGGIVCAVALAVAKPALILIALPFSSRSHSEVGSIRDVWSAYLPDGLAPVAGLGILLGLAAVAAATGGLLARLAPALLESAADRLAALQRRAAELAERNRLARELHDSVGHALSTVTIQAGAAGRVMDRDPAFVRRALSAIEESSRAAVDDLDHVLGLLREDGKQRSATRPQRTLGDLDGLLSQTRDAGVEVHAELTGDPERLPPAVSREAYRIVQEGLTNALRHAGAVPVSLRVDVQPDVLRIELTNPIGDAHEGRLSGGRGLSGIAERVAILGGQVDTSAVEGEWRVTVEVPL
jgi:signal transduction histidine kinase